MNKRNKKCIVCGKEYTFCSGCDDFNHLPRWMSIYHDENCKNIFMIATDYNAGDLNKEDAKARLNKCDLSNKKSFHKNVLKAINEINAVNGIKENNKFDEIVKSKETEETNEIKEINEVDEIKVETNKKIKTDNKVPTEEIKENVVKTRKTGFKK